MAPQQAEVVKQIRATLAGLVAATVLLFFVCGGIALYASSVASDSTNAVCALRTDLHEQVATSREFIATHDLGQLEQLSRAQIQNKVETISALSGVAC